MCPPGFLGLIFEDMDQCVIIYYLIIINKLNLSLSLLHHVTIIIIIIISHFLWASYYMLFGITSASCFTIHSPLSVLTSHPLFPFTSSQVTMVTHSSIFLLPRLVSMRAPHPSHSDVMDCVLDMGMCIP